jgi:anionic cell wall polymer biosynthesis LytR-Cps2A-Psr (LCP) family protein
MATKPREHEEPRRDHSYIEGHQGRIAGRGLGYLILLNGVAAIVMVGAFVYGFQTSVEPKLAAAMVVFGIGAITGLLSSFIAYLNRIVRMEFPDRPHLPSALRLVAIVAVIVSGAAFLSGLSMVGTTSTARSSSQPKTRPQDKALPQGHASANKDSSRIQPNGDEKR